MSYYLFLLGLGGSLHCLGMCGPLCILATINVKNKLNLVFDMLVYHGGRLLMYILLGAIIGSIGHLFQLNKIQSYISIVIGLLLLLYGVNKFIKIKYIDKLNVSNNYFIKIYNVLLKENNLVNTFLLGGINGLVPCGLVYSAMAISFMNASITTGAVNMLAFGLGTLPLLLLFTFSSGSQKIKSYLKLPYVSGTLFTISGLFIIYKAVLVSLPENASLWSMIVDPVMCH